MTGILHGTCKCCEESICCGSSGCEIDIANISLVFNAQMYKAVYEWHCYDSRCMDANESKPCGDCTGTFPWNAADSDTTGTWDSDEGCIFPGTLTTITYPPVCTYQQGNGFATRCTNQVRTGCPNEAVGEILGTRCVLYMQEDFSVTFDWNSDWQYDPATGYLHGLADAIYNTYHDKDEEGYQICDASHPKFRQCCDDFVTKCTCPMEVKISCYTGEVILHCAPSPAGGCISASDCYSECGPGEGSTCAMNIAGSTLSCGACGGEHNWLVFPPNETWPSVSTDCPERLDSQNGGVRKFYHYSDDLRHLNQGCWAKAFFRRIVGNFNLNGKLNEECD